MTKLYCKGIAIIAHKETNRTFEIDSEELDWECEGSERNMGVEAHHWAQIEHEVLGLLTWNLWEYPLGVENNRKTDTRGHRIIEDFDYGLEHELDDPAA